jgi:hypothetical protein
MPCPGPFDVHASVLAVNVQQHVAVCGRQAAFQLGMHRLTGIVWVTAGCKDPARCP